MSNSSEGKILLNILKSLPKRGIWMIRQEGAWGSGKTEKEKAYVVINKAAWTYQRSSQELKPEAKLPEQSLHNLLDIHHITDLNN